MVNRLKQKEEKYLTLQKKKKSKSVFLSDKNYITLFSLQVLSNAKKGKKKSKPSKNKNMGTVSRPGGMRPKWHKKRLKRLKLRRRKQRLRAK